MKLRVITALCLVPLVLAAVFLLPFDYFSLFVGAIYLLAAREWGQFIDPEKSGVLLISLGLVLFGLMGLVPLHALWQEGASADTLAAGLHNNTVWMLAVGGVWWLVALLMVASYPRSAALWRANPGMKAMSALLTLAPFYYAVLVLRSFQYQENAYFGAWLLLFVMALVWAADTGAYFVGKALGKRKLCPHVSPGKTIEGMLGGVLAAMVFAVIVIQSVNLGSGQGAVILVASLVAVLASVLGDLTESMFKREAGLKDSGNILPGHGGIMDRIDGLTSALPVFVLVVWLLS